MKVGDVGLVLMRLLVGSRQSTLAADATTLTLREATPDAELLTVGEGVLEAVVAHDTAPAHLLGLPRGLHLTPVLVRTS